MKKSIVVMALFLGILGTAFADGLSLVGMKNFQNQNWRVGVGVPTYTYKPLQLGLDTLVMTDATPLSEVFRYGANGQSVSNLYVGLGAHKTLINKGNFNLDAMVGYSTDLTSLKHPHNGAWGFGAEFGYRF